MKRIHAVCSVTFIAATATIAGYTIYTNQKIAPISSLVLSNIEALANGGESSDQILSCCGNIGICAKGPDGDTGEEIIIRGILSNKPCN